MFTDEYAGGQHCDRTPMLSTSHPSRVKLTLPPWRTGLTGCAFQDATLSNLFTGCYAIAQADQRSRHPQSSTAFIRLEGDRNRCLEEGRVYIMKMDLHSFLEAHQADFIHIKKPVKLDHVGALVGEADDTILFDQIEGVSRIPPGRPALCQPQSPGPGARLQAVRGGETSCTDHA